MVLEAIKCPYCSEVELVKKHGRAVKGTQRYRYYACKKSFLRDSSYRAHLREVKVQMSEMAMKGNGILDTAHAPKVNKNTMVSYFFKK